MSNWGRLMKLSYFAALACPLSLMLLLSLSPGISFNEDLGRHLVLGKIICDTYSVPQTNLLSYTYPDFPFINHHWLSEVFLYLAHSVSGINGLIVIKMILTVLALGISLIIVTPVFKDSDKTPFFPIIVWICGILSSVIIGFRSHIRPELATFLFTALFLFAFEFARKLRENGKGTLLPRLILLGAIFLWSNLHIYFIFGIGMLGAFAVERSLEERNGRTLRKESLFLFACLLAASLNPSGIKGFAYPLNIFSNYGVSITENLSPLEYCRDTYNPMLFAVPLLSIMLLAALVCRIVCFWRDKGKNAESHRSVPAKFADFPICIAALTASCLMARSTPILAICAIPAILSAYMQFKPRPVFHGVKARTLFPIMIVFLSAINIFLVWTVVNGAYSRIFPSPIAPTPFGFDKDDRYVALQKLKDSYGLAGPVFNDYNIGSLLEYELYPEKSYCDNRPEAFPGHFWKYEYEPALRLGAEWSEICRMREFRSLIVSTTGVKENFIRKIISSPEWRLVHIDELSAVFVRDSPENAEIIKNCFLDEERILQFSRKISEDLLVLPDLPFWRRQVEANGILFRLYGLVCIGREDLAWQYVWQMHLMYPDHKMLHELMRVTAPPENVSDIEDLFAKNAKWPLSSEQVAVWARHLIAKGRNDEAIRVLRRGRIFFPFSESINKLLQELKPSQAFDGL